MAARTDLYLNPTTFAVVPHKDVTDADIQVNMATVADLMRFGLFFNNKDALVKAMVAANRQTRTTLVVNEKATDDAKAETHRKLSITTTFCNIPSSVVLYYFNYVGATNPLGFCKAYVSACQTAYVLDKEGKPTKEIDVGAMHTKAGIFMASMLEMETFTAIVPALLQEATVRAIAVDASSMKENESGEFESSTTLSDLTAEFVRAVCSNDVLNAVATIMRVNMRFHRSLLKNTSYKLEGKPKDIMSNWLRGAVQFKTSKYNKRLITSMLTLMTMLKNDWPLAMVVACQYLCQPGSVIHALEVNEDELPYDSKVASRLTEALNKDDTLSATVGGHGMDGKEFPEKAFGSGSEVGALHLGRTIKYDVDMFFKASLSGNEDDKARVQQLCTDLVEKGTPSDLIRKHLVTHKLIRGVSKAKKRAPTRVTELPVIDLDDLKMESIDVLAAYYLAPPSKRFEQLVVQLELNGEQCYYTAVQGLTPASKRSITAVALPLDRCRTAWGINSNGLLYVEDNEHMFSVLETVSDTSKKPTMVANPKFTIDGEVAEFVDTETWCSSELTPLGADVSGAASWSDDIRLQILTHMAFRTIHGITVRNLFELFLVHDEDDGDKIIMAPEFNKGSKVNIGSTEPWHTVLFGSSKMPSSAVLQVLYTQLPKLLEVATKWKKDVEEEKKQERVASDDDDDDDAMLCGFMSSSDIISRLELLILCLRQSVKKWEPPTKKTPAKKAPTKKAPTKKVSAKKNAVSVKTSKASAKSEGKKRKASAKSEGKKRKAEVKEDEENTSDSDAEDDDDESENDSSLESSSDEEEEEKEEDIVAPKKRRMEKNKLSPKEKKRNKVAFTDDTDADATLA